MQLLPNLYFNFNKHTLLCFNLLSKAVILHSTLQITMLQHDSSATFRIFDKKWMFLSKTLAIIYDTQTFKNLDRLPVAIFDCCSFTSQIPHAFRDALLDVVQEVTDVKEMNKLGCFPKERWNSFRGVRKLSKLLNLFGKFVLLKEEHILKCKVF